jgi:hypothetical protein
VSGSGRNVKGDRKHLTQPLGMLGFSTSSEWFCGKFQHPTHCGHSITTWVGLQTPWHTRNVHSSVTPPHELQPDSTAKYTANGQLAYTNQLSVSGHWSTQSRSCRFRPSAMRACKDSRESSSSRGVVGFNLQHLTTALAFLRQCSGECRVLYGGYHTLFAMCSSRVPIVEHE